MTTEPRGETYRFTIAYGGDALVDHLMPVRELAPALLALGEAFDRANELVNDDRAQVSLAVQATEAGSFNIDLVLNVLANGGIPLLNDPRITAALNLKDLLFDNGLFSLIKLLGNRQPEVVHRDETNVTINISGDLHVYNARVLTLHEDRRIRQLAREVVMPLERDGMDTVEVREGDKILETIRKDDLSAFALATLEPNGVGSEFTERGVFLQPASTNLRGRGRWRLTDGSKTNAYEMADVVFRREVENGLRVGAKDTLVCDVTVQQTLADDGTISTRYRVDRVSQHIAYAGPRQMRLDDNTTPQHT